MPADSDIICDIIRQTAGMVAAALGDGWAVDTDYTGWGAKVDGPGGERLYFHSTDYRNADRLEISGGYPAPTPYGVRRHSITVRRDRGPEIVAREIGRRLLPEYRNDLRKVLESQRRDADATSRRAELAKALSLTGTDSGSRFTAHVRFPDSYGTVAIHYAADAVDVELRDLTPGQAARILNVARGGGG